MGFRVEGFARIRSLPRPEDGLRAVVERVPQVEAALDRLTERFRPTGTRLYRLRRRIATGGILVLTAWLFLHVVFGANGMVIYRQKRTEVQRLQQEVASWQKQNERSGEQIKALKSDRSAIEKEAREQLHLARPNEFIYVAPSPASPSKPETDAAKK